ncbi:MAG: hydrogenase formation protein HypD [Candidatus Omnitrophica bacterium]|nr:hydrogenase formation protein HypD [Candidatus Omnitrophota bacterium]
MKYIDEFRDKDLVKKVAEKIKAIMPPRKVNIMEVCGTHTHAFFRFGLDKVLPEQLSLISGPGCPVCVSPQEYIDAAIGLCARKDTIILTFADMLRVPGRISTLEKERAEGAHVRVVYSALDSLKVARENPAKKIVFLAVGFETTAPTIALSILAAKKEKLKNLFFFSSLKLIPPAMELLARDKDLNLDGFLCPGHVSVIIGTRPYEFIAKKYKIGCCVAGFEPLDILEGIFLLLRQMAVKMPVVDNQYARAVTAQGNRKAQELMRRVFKAADARWRGLSIIPSSGLKIKNEFLEFDAEKSFGIKYPIGQKEDTKCRCHDVLKGLISPRQCPLFARACAPDHPLGACMVSTEGACNAYFKYKK